MFHWKEHRGRQQGQDYKRLHTTQRGYKIRDGLLGCRRNMENIQGGLCGKNIAWNI